jgi:bifunctional non-homologous end joining protein LigD
MAPQRRATKHRLSSKRSLGTRYAAVRSQVLAEIDRLEGEPTGGTIHIDDCHSLTVRHPTRVLWPALGVTTVDLMRYYVEVSSVLLPYTKDRPLSFRRFDKGIDGPSQFHQRIKWPTPPGVRTASFAAKGKDFETRLIGGDLTTLLYCVNLAIISQDVWLSKVDEPDGPDYAVFDFDPAPGVPFEQVIQVARRLHEVLEQYRVPHGIKTSGVSGLHIYVPVAHIDYRTTRAFVTQFATHVAERFPRLATVTRSISRRAGRVYIDPDQNMRAKTMAAPYSARHSRFAGVSAPLTWQELEAGARPEDFTILTMLDRLPRIGDLWASLGRQPLDLAELLKQAA